MDLYIYWEYMEYMEYMECMKSWIQYLNEFETKIENILECLWGAQMGSFGQTALNKKSHASVLLSLLFSHLRLEQWKYIPNVPTILQLALSPSFFVSS